MTLVFEKNIQTNQNREIRVFEYNNLYLKKADLLGCFQMGSTIVMLFEKDFVKLKVKEGQKVKFGECVATHNF